MKVNYFLLLQLLRCQQQLSVFEMKQDTQPWHRHCRLPALIRQVST